MRQHETRWTARDALRQGISNGPRPRGGGGPRRARQRIKPQAAGESAVWWCWPPPTSATTPPIALVRSAAQAGEALLVKLEDWRKHAVSRRKAGEVARAQP